MGATPDHLSAPPAEPRGHPSGLTRRERRMRRGFVARKLGFNDRWAVALDWVIFATFTVLVAWVLQAFVVSSFWIPSESMVPTLEKGDRILVNKLSTEPGRGDVVVFNSVRRAPDEPADLVKRVVGLPGETIEAKDGVVLVNGAPLTERYLPAGTRTDDFGPALKDTSGAPLLGPDGAPVTKIPAGSYFVMGDNRGASFDSRYWGVVPAKNIIGEALARFWPLGRIGTL